MTRSADSAVLSTTTGTRSRSPITTMHVCPMCQYPIVCALGNVVTLECGHLIHNVPCQHEWLQCMSPTQRSECPICRAPLPSLDAVRPGGTYEVPYVSVLSSSTMPLATDFYFSNTTTQQPSPSLTPPLQ